MIRLQRPICPNPRALTRADYKNPINKEALKNASFGKCMYCESKIPHIDHAHVEHIKPKAKDKYPELEFVWENHGYSCAKCNGSKSDKYDEQTPFINPYEEDPEEHITFLGWFATPKKGSERGELTITEISLNRIELIERRKEKIELIINTISLAYRTRNQSLRDQTIELLKQEAGNNKEYSSAIKCVLENQGII